jgi:hypothetical protein
VRATTQIRTLVIAMALLILLPAGAGARDGDRDGEVRVAGTCGGSVTSKLKVKSRDGGLEVEVEVEHALRGSSWRLTLSQEGRVVWHGTARAGRSTGSFQVERRLRDLAGADRVSVRASGPRGTSCRAAATLPGD